MIDISWAGKIPDNWEYAPLKSQFSFGKGLSITKADLCETGEPVLSYGQIHSKDNDRTCIPNDLLRFVPKAIVDASPDSLAINGGFIFADTSEDLDGCGNCNYVDRDGIYGGYHTVVLKPQDITDNKYLAYLFQTDAWRYQLRKELTEVKLYSVSQKALKSTWVLVPPISERQAIVRYLDSKCSAIDEAIERHKKIIEKLAEYKASVSSWAVLHGIDNNSPIKPSGVEWIGDIPSSWEMKRGKYLFCEISDRSEEGKEELLTVSQYTGITPRSQKNVTMFEAESLVGYKICEIGDIPANTMWLWAGAIGVSKYYGVISPSYNVYRQTAHAYDSEYLDCMLRSVPLVQHYKANSTGIRPSRLRLYPPQFLDIKFPVPPINEQKKIVSFLNDKFSTVNNALSRANEMIAKLEEYRKSIIYHAVTGKIDCRNS